MTADQRIRIAIGELFVQLQIALARVEELEAQAKERAPEQKVTNGKDVYEEARP